MATTLGRTVGSIRPSYGFDETCQRTVPEALVALLDSTGFEHARRLAVSLGGDSDTLACITGSVSEAFYGGVPDGIAEETHKRLTPEMLAIVGRFATRFGRSGWWGWLDEARLGSDPRECLGSALRRSEHC